MAVMRRHSRKRDAILHCIKESREHPSAEWIYTQLKPEHPDLSLGTACIFETWHFFVKTVRLSASLPSMVSSDWMLIQNNIRISFAMDVMQ